MAGHRLVMGQGRQRPFRPGASVAQVDIIGARPRAIEAWPLRITAGRAELDRGRHPLDLHRRTRDRREHLRHAPAQPVHISGEIGEHLGPARVGVRIEMPLQPAERGDPGAHAALGQAFRAEQGLGLGAQLGELAKSGLVDLFGAHAGRGVEAQALRIEGAAAGQPARRRIVAGAAAELGQQGQLAVQRRGEAAIDNRCGLARPVALDMLLARAPDQRLDQVRLLATLATQRPGLGDRLVEDEVGRDDPAAGIGAGLLDLQLHVARERLKP